MQTEPSPKLNRRERKQARLAARPKSKIRDALSITGALLLLGFTGFAAFYKFPNVVYLPGNADALGERLKVTGAPEFKPKGRVLMATVSQVLEPRFVDMVDAWIRDEVDTEKRVDVLGDVSVADSRKISQDMMDNSKQVAMVVAARKLGLPTRGGAVEVLELDPKAPAAKVLKVGDDIVTIDGEPLCLVGDLRQKMAGRKPGDQLSLTIRRGGKGDEVPVTAELMKSPDGRAIFGMYAGPSQSTPCTTNFAADFKTGNIGGPSAGLSMALTLLDTLSPGELTGGQIVATTGTIEADGSVGPIGGLKQKTYAVKKAGAKLFLVPADELGEATPYAGDMKVVGVRTLDDALKALEAFGGDPLPTR
jgi:Lon-like protease